MRKKLLGFAVLSTAAVVCNGFHPYAKSPPRPRPRLETQKLESEPVTAFGLVDRDDALARVHLHELYDQKGESSRWLHCLKTWPKSYVLKRVRSPVIGFTLWGAFLACVNCLELASNLPQFLVGTDPIRGLSQALSLFGGTISLLLVFRTNTAYARFWEGRQIWEQLSSTSRNLASLTEMYAEEVGPAPARRIAALLSAFPVSLQLHLQGIGQHSSRRKSASPGSRVCRLFLELGGDFKGGENGGSTIPYDKFIARLRRDDRLAALIDLPTDQDETTALEQLHRARFGFPRPPRQGVGLAELAAYFKPLELERLLPGVSGPNLSPLALSRDLLATIKTIPYDDDKFTSRERLAFVKEVHKLQQLVSASERIVYTPVPLHYVRFTSRFLSAWCIALPLAVTPQLGFLVAPLMAVVSWALFGLREIGVIIENPFRRCLAIQMVSASIRQDMESMLGRSSMESELALRGGPWTHSRLEGPSDPHFSGIWEHN
mmetsp:Transcript_22637/g.51088  ORF Transcript_22637/g.51088 Transcript_22637/m.51088 type:complete len:489 (-) Transcript_22637:94-1560(-)